MAAKLLTLLGGSLLVVGWIGGSFSALDAQQPPSIVATSLAAERGLPELPWRLTVSAQGGPIRLASIWGDEKVILRNNHESAAGWSPGGDRLAYVDGRPGNGGQDYAISIADTLGNLVELPVPLWSTWPQYSADGWIWFFTQHGARDVYRIRPDGSELQKIAPGAFPSPSPDGSRVAFVTNNGIEVRTVGASEGYLLPGTQGARVVYWSPDGEWLAYWTNGTVVLISPAGSGPRTFAAPSGIGGLAWSPDSRWLIAGNGGPFVLLEVTTGKRWDLPVRGMYVAFRRTPVIDRR